VRGLAQFGETRQRLLRQLLLAAAGLGIEDFCIRLGITHNAVRQHLTALMARGLVARGPQQPTAGRPQARYVLTTEGRALFPRNYAAIATALLALLQDRLGEQETGALMHELGAGIAATQEPIREDGGEPLARALAQHLDALGYEAVVARHDGDWQVEAFNCVFHELARRHPQVCRFDIAYMEAISGRRVHHLECMVRGGHACRFRAGPPPAPPGPAPVPPAIPRSPGATQ